MLVWFCGAKHIDRQEFFKEIFLSRAVTPCLRMSVLAQYSLSTDDCRELFIVFLVDVGATRIFSCPCTDENLRRLKRAPGCGYPLFDWYYHHYRLPLFCLSCRENGLNKMFCARRGCCKVFSGRRVYLRLYSPIIRLGLPPCREKGYREDFAVKFSVGYISLS